MKLLSATLLLLPILMLTSCSSGSWSDLFEENDTDERNQELMEDFGAEGEVLEKFSEKKEEALPRSQRRIMSPKKGTQKVAKKKAAPAPKTAQKAPAQKENQFRHLKSKKQTKNKTCAYAKNHKERGP